jgi:4-amino-4-deoxy-L-arabinose transferase-like glycosyltransferase
MMRTALNNEPAVGVRWISLSTVLLLLAIGAGIFLRFSGIGKYGFWTDELFHVFAALSFLEDGSFHVPWEPDEYTRALPITLLTAISFKLFGESEASARVIFALANVIFIVIAYRILKNQFSRNVALIFVISMSLSIFSIQMSQECRMYTPFQLFYFLMTIAFIRGFEPDLPAGDQHTPGLFSYLQARGGISFKYLGLSLVLGLIALVLHDLTFNFVFVVLAYCIVMFVYCGLHEGFRGLIISKYSVITILVVVIPLVLVLTRSQFMVDLANVAVEIPSWNRLAQSNLTHYHWVLTSSHPILWAIYPLGMFLTIYRYGRRGLFFVLSFCVLFVMHSFFFGRVAGRYIFYLLPFFIAVAAVGIDFILSSIVTFATNSASALSRWKRVLFYTTLIISLAIIVYPRVQQTVLDTSVPKFSNWKDLDPAIIQTVKKGPSVTTDRLRFNYYFGQYPDYVIDASDVDHVGGERVIVTLAEFEQVLARHPDLYLVTYVRHIYNEAFVDPALSEFILRELDRFDSEDDDRIMVFRGRSKEVN